jgi:hypothetical protein
MIAYMAEVKRELIWIQTAFFMGWGCNICCWKDFLPRDVPILLAPSPEARRAFTGHNCERTKQNSREQLISQVRPRHMARRSF